MTVTVVVSNTDPAITYSGSWATQNAADTIDPSNFFHGVKPTIGDTVHATTLDNVQNGVSQSHLSFKFTGTAVNVYALLTPSFAGQLYGGDTWKCLVDGKETPRVSVILINRPATMKICQQAGLSDGSHTLTMEAIMSTEFSSQLFIDYIDYVPSPNARQVYNYISVSAQDWGMKYSPEWKETEAGDSTHGMTTLGNVPRATMSYQFKGASIACLGWTLGATHSSRLVVSVDGYPTEVDLTIKPPVVYETSGLNLPGNKFYQNNTLNPAVPHTIEITYTQDPGALVPLVMAIQGFLIGSVAETPAAIGGTTANNPPATGGIISATGTSTTSTATSASQSLLSFTWTGSAIPSGSPTNSAPAGAASSDTASGDKKITPTAAIAGGTVGGVVVVVLLAILFFLLWRRRQRHTAATSLDDPFRNPS